LIAPQLKRGFHNLEKYYKNMPRERFIPLPDVRTILSARNRFVSIMQQEIFIYVIENQYTCSFCFGVIPIKLSYLKISLGKNPVDIVLNCMCQSPYLG
jgi:hypothetical protein